MLIALPIFGICLKIEKLGIGERCMYIHIAGWHTFAFRPFRSLLITHWWMWCSGRRGCQLWWRCTHDFMHSTWMQNHCCVNLTRKAAISSIVTNYCWESFHHSLHISMLKQLNSVFWWSQSSAQGVLINCFVFSIVVCANRSGAILPIFNARRMSYRSSYTQPLYIGIVADMFETYNK